jgi:hypothetical protein
VLTELTVPSLAIQGNSVSQIRVLLSVFTYGIAKRLITERKALLSVTRFAAAFRIMQNQVQNYTVGRECVIIVACFSKLQLQINF